MCMSEHTVGRGVPEFHLGDRLNKALAHAGMSHQEMAEYLGVTRNTVGNYIGLRTPVTLGTLRLWALRTGVDMEWLQTGVMPGNQGPNGPDGGHGSSMDTGWYPTLTAA